MFVSTPDGIPIEEPAAEGDGVGSARVIRLESWWLASELVRRHPGFVVSQDYMAGGMYDALLVRVLDDENERTALVVLNRSGSLQVWKYPGPDPEGTWIANWIHIVLSDDPHQYVRAIEEVLRVDPPGKTPGSTPRSLAYRFIYTALEFALHERHQWHFKNELFVGGASGGGPLGNLGRFPLAYAAAREMTLEGWEPGGSPEVHFWGLHIDDDVVAFVSDKGVLYIGNDVVDLQAEYHRHGRDIRRVVLDTLFKRA